MRENNGGTVALLLPARGAVRKRRLRAIGLYSMADLSLSSCLTFAFFFLLFVQVTPVRSETLLERAVARERRTLSNLNCGNSVPYHSIVNPHHRGELVELANLLGLTGHVAEVGCDIGLFSHHNLQHWRGGPNSMYHMIDAWAYRPNHKTGDGKSVSRDKNNADPASHSARFQQAMQNIAPWRSRVATVRNLSVAAASHFKDAHFDFIYIDAGHEYQHVLDDLRAWWPKLRCGGLFAGDDFADAHDRGGSVKECAAAGGARKHGFGVKSAVAHFALEVGSPFFLTFADRFRSGKKNAASPHDPTCSTMRELKFGKCSEWAPDHPTSLEAQIARQNGIQNPVRSNAMYPAWFMFK